MTTINIVLVRMKQLQAGALVRCPGQRQLREVVRIDEADEHGLHSVHFKDGHSHRYHKDAHVHVQQCPTPASGVERSASPRSASAPRSATRSRRVRVAPRTSTQGASNADKIPIFVAYGPTGHACCWSKIKAKALRNAGPGGVVREYMVKPFTGAALPEGAVPAQIEMPASAPASMSRPTPKRRSTRKASAVVRRRSARRAPAPKATPSRAQPNKAPRAPAPASTHAAKEATGEASGRRPASRSATRPSARGTRRTATSTAAPTAAARRRPGRPRHRPASAAPPSAPRAATSVRTASAATAAPEPAEASPPTQVSRRTPVAVDDEAVLTALRDKLVKEVPDKAEQAYEGIRALWFGGGREAALAWQTAHGIPNLADAFADWMAKNEDAAAAILTRINEQNGKAQGKRGRGRAGKDAA